MTKTSGEASYTHRIHVTNGILTYMKTADSYGFHVGKYTIHGSYGI